MTGAMGINCCASANSTDSHNAFVSIAANACAIDVFC